MEIPTKKYRVFSLWDPVTKKSRSKRVLISDFQSNEEMERYIDALKTENTAKNAEYRKEKRRELYTNKIESMAQPKTFTPVKFPSPKVDGPLMNTLKMDHTTGSTMCIYGSSKRGKSTLMMHIYDHEYGAKSPYAKDYISTLFAGNPQLKIYKKDPKLIVGYGFGQQQAKYVMLQQYINTETKNKYQFLNLFDDIIDQKQSPVIQKMVLTYRNANISMIMCLQDLKMLSRQSRANINHTVFFGNNRVEEDKIVVEEYLKGALYARGLLTLGEQITFFRAATADHGFVYLNNITGEMSVHRLRLE